MGAVIPAGGEVVLIVPAFQSLYGPIDAKLGHYRRYTKRSLAELAFSQGFEVTLLRYLHVVGCFGWWFNARVTKRTAQSQFQIALFDSFVVPFMSRIERLIEPPCGQSIFAVMVKRR